MLALNQCMSVKTLLLILGVFVFCNCTWWLSSNDFLSSVLKPHRSVRKTKTILLWNSFFSRRDYYFGLGYSPFVDNNCRHNNCYLTYDREMLSMDQYDAIVFHAPQFSRKSFNDSYLRSQDQLYAFLSMESPLNMPVSKDLNRFFNVTMTYRRDSDAQIPYFYFADLEGYVVSPTSGDPRWKSPEGVNYIKHVDIHERKSKPAAWFCSNCRTHSKRESIVKALQKHIAVDVYGRCGPLKCPRSDEEKCFEMLQRDYYFYLSFENSLCDDYITEKAVNPYRYETVPIILSGANLSAFLPPDSYIDASTMSVRELADLMKRLMASPEEYAKYFWWKDYYKPSDGDVYTAGGFCTLCEILNENDRKIFYDDIVKWWHGDANKDTCDSGAKRANSKLYESLPRSVDRRPV